MNIILIIVLNIYIVCMLIWFSYNVTHCLNGFVDLFISKQMACNLGTTLIWLYLIFLFQNQEHLKPPIIGHLANAELYCLALSNMYSDPNYHNLNHWNILQTLARKGLHVANPSDCTLTETVLIQTNPLRMVNADI